MLEPEYTAEKIRRTTLAFYALSLHPKALRFELRTDGVLTAEGIVRRESVECFQKEGQDLVDGFTGLTSDFEPGSVSLRKRAIYWPVERARLEVAEGNENNLYDTFEGWQARVDDPYCVLIHKSDWDHTVWDTEAKQILMPVELSLWGTRFNLDEVSGYLKSHPAVVSFEVVSNTCWQNHGISGTHLGKLIVDPKKFAPSALPKVVSKSWLQHEVVEGLSGTAHDLLGLAPFRSS
jgi:hypothetical protein